MLLKAKVISRSFGHISHLPGSKMINDQDHLLGKAEIGYLTVQSRDPRDIVIVTEKIDGMNSSVLRKDDKLYPLMRKGYDVRTSNIPWIKAFADYVEDNGRSFMSILDNGERACGEWMIKTHTLSYNIRDPFIMFDIIAGNYHFSYFDFCNRIRGKFPHTGIVHIGKPIPVDLAMSLLGSGFHGVEDGEPEGVVYRYENYTNGFECYGKFVANKKLGNDEYFHADDDCVFNEVKRCYRKYTR